MENIHTSALNVLSQKTLLDSKGPNLKLARIFLIGLLETVKGIMMNLKMSKILIVSLWVLTCGFAQAEFDRALIETEEGLQYVSVAQRNGDDYIVGHARFSCRWSCTRSSGFLRVPHDGVLFATSSISVRTQRQTHDISRDDVILGNDGIMYQIRDVFPNGHIVAYALNANPGHFGGEVGNIDPLENRNVYVISTDNIAAVEVPCFLGICSGQRYREISGVPLCDSSLLRATQVRDGVVLGVPERLSCRVDRSAPIDFVFSDGTLANGPRVFNPFPSTLENYYRHTELGSSTPATSAL